MRRLTYIVVISCFVFFVQHANAKHEMQGGIGEVVTEQKEAWKSSQESFLALLNNVITALETKQQLPLIPQYQNETLLQVTSAYFACSKIQGPCEFILDTLLEMEILKSKSSQKLDCRNIKIFWKNWIEQNYDKQVLYDIKLSQAEKFENFKKNRMARYVKCEKTMKDFVENKNYKTPSNTLLKMKKTHKILNLLFNKYGNIAALYSKNTDTKNVQEDN